MVARDLEAMHVRERIRMQVRERILMQIRHVTLLGRNTGISRLVSHVKQSKGGWYRHVDTY